MSKFDEIDALQIASTYEEDLINIKDTLQIVLNQGYSDCISLKDTIHYLEKAIHSIESSIEWIDEKIEDPFLYEE